MALKINTDFQNKVLEGGFKVCLSNGSLNIYGGTRPTKTSDPPGGTALVTIALGEFGAPSDGFMNLATMPGGTGLNNGTATWYRITQGTYIMDGDVGEDLGLDNAEIQKDKMVKILALVLHQPGG